MSINITEILRGFHYEFNFYSELFNRLHRIIIPINKEDGTSFKIANQMLKNLADEIRTSTSVSALSSIIDIQLLEDTWERDYAKITNRDIVVSEYNKYLVGLLENVENEEFPIIEPTISMNNYERYDQPSYFILPNNENILRKYYVIVLERENFSYAKGFSDNINIIKEYFRCRNISLDDPDYVVYEYECHSSKELCDLYPGVSEQGEFYSIISYDGKKSIIISDSLEVDLSECECFDSLVTDLTETVLMIYNLLIYLEDTEERKFLYYVFNKLKTLYLVLIFIANNTDPEWLSIEGFNITCPLDLLDRAYYYYYYGFEWEGIQIE